MSRLIDADELRQVLEVYSEKDSLGHTPLQLCDAMPTIDAVEVVHGEWEKGIHMVECSVCSEKFDFGDETWVEDFDICEDIGWRYCPNCGAKMDGEVKNNEQTI